MKELIHRAIRRLIYSKLISYFVKSEKLSCHELDFIITQDAINDLNKALIKRISDRTRNPYYGRIK